MRAERSAIVQMEINNSEQSHLNKKKPTIQMTKWGKREWEKKDQNDFYVSETRNSIWYQSNLIFNFNCNATFLKNVSNGFIQFLFNANEWKKRSEHVAKSNNLTFFQHFLQSRHHLDIFESKTNCAEENALEIISKLKRYTAFDEKPIFNSILIYWEGSKFLYFNKWLTSLIQTPEKAYKNQISMIQMNRIH